MNDSNLPRETLRTLGVLLVLAFDFALEKGRDAIERIKPMVDPPDDLRVVSTSGCLYSGLVVIDRGEVLAGIVVATGFDPIRAATTRAATMAPPMSSPSQSPLMRREPTTRLPGWAEDTTDYDDDRSSPWRR